MMKSRKPIKNSADSSTFSQLSDEEEMSHYSSAFNNDATCLKQSHEVPAWYRGNKSLIFGYRPINNSYRDCFYSLFQLHNETGNIWSHLLGAILFIWLRIKLNQNDLMKSLNKVDVFCFDFYFFGAIICFTFSTCFHLFVSHSKPLFRVLAKCDYCGITTLISCSYSTFMHYAFYNTPSLQATYIGLNGIFTIVCIAMSCSSKFSEPNFRFYRTMLFMCDGLSGIIPSVHWCIREMNNNPTPFFQLNLVPFYYLLLMAISYLTGALVYLYKIPEHYWTKTFDLWLHSHQLFHIFVVFGALFYYHSLFAIISIRKSDPTYFFN